MSKQLYLIEPFVFLPPDSGGKNRIKNTVNELLKQFSLTILFFSPNQSDQTQTTQFLEKQQIPFKSFTNRPKSLFSFIKWGKPYWFSDWYNPVFSQSLKRISAESAPTIMVEFSQLLDAVDHLPRQSKKIFVAHDISTVSFWRRLVSEPNLLKKIIGLIRWIEVYLYEKKYIPQYNVVVAVSQHDAHILKHWFKAQTVLVVPNGIEKVKELPPRTSDGFLNLGFIGSPSHPPNQQAIDFLVGQIAPTLTKRNIKFRIVLAGSNMYAGDNPIAKNMGYVNDIHRFYQAIDLMVAPIFSGSGSRIKILESLSFGRPVVTTAIGAEGIDLHTSFLKIIPSSEQKNPDQWVNKLLSSINYGDFPAADLSNITWEKIFAKSSSFLSE